LVVLRLDLGQFSFSLVENAFATRQLAILAFGIAFKTFWPRHAQKSIIIIVLLQVNLPYPANLYFPPLFPPPRPAGHMLIAVKAMNTGYR